MASFYPEVPVLHSQLTSEQMKGLLGISPIPGSQLVSALGPLALASITDFKTSPRRLSVPLMKAKAGWLQQLVTAVFSKKVVPATAWLVAAQVDSESWMWLGAASCNSWSLDRLGNATEADLVLLNAIPKADYLKLRNNDPWFTMGWSIELEGDFNSSASQRLHSAASQNYGQVFLERWEGDQFGLQFDETRSVFFTLRDGDASSTAEVGYCQDAAVLGIEPDDVLGMLCPCCGVQLKSFPIQVHMPREFGFFVMGKLLESQKLPEVWPGLPEGRNKIIWAEVEALNRGHL